MVEIDFCLPDLRLRPFIKMYFWGRDANPPLAQRVVPNGEMGLLFYRGNKVSLDGDRSMQSCIKGQSMRYHDIISMGGIEIVGAHFTVLGASLFFKVPLIEHFETTTELDDLKDCELMELKERVMLANCHTECWKEMERFFLHKLSSNTDIELLNLRRLHRAISYGQHHIATARIGDIASEACLSQRQFGRLFVNLVGLSPKDYIRLLRYRNTLLDLKRNSCILSMEEIAWRNGYYDYSHLFYDFRKISGYSPKQLLKVSASENDTVGWRI